MGEGCSDESVPGTALLLDLEQTERSTFVIVGYHFTFLRVLKPNKEKKINI